MMITIKTAHKKYITLPITAIELYSQNDKYEMGYVYNQDIVQLITKEEYERVMKIIGEYNDNYNYRFVHSGN